MSEILLSVSAILDTFLLSVLMQELMTENNDLRESLQSMQTELINLLNHQNEDYDHVNDTEVCIAIN